MKYLLLIVLVFASTAKGYRLLDVEELSADIAQIQDNYDPYFKDKPSSEWQNTVGLNWNVSILPIAKNWGGYWHNRVYYDSDWQVRMISWKYELGLHLGPYLEAFKAHQSRHMAEESPDQHFPCYDSIGVRFIFIRK